MENIKDNSDKLNINDMITTKIILKNKEKDNKTQEENENFHIKIDKNTKLITIIDKDIGDYKNYIETFTKSNSNNNKNISKDIQTNQVKSNKEQQEENLFINKSTPIKQKLNNEETSLDFNSLLGEVQVKEDEYEEIITKDNYDYILNEVNNQHPIKIIDGKTEDLSLNSNFGWFCCGKDKSKSELSQFSLGFEVYFKILKALIVCFLLISLINIPIILIYSMNNSNITSNNYKDSLFKTTIGNLGTSK